MKNLSRILLVPALALPLTAATCTSDKLVELVIGVTTTAEFIASGETNVHEDTDTIDLKDDLDLAAELEDAEIDPADVQEIQLAQVFYRITQAEAGRSIEDGFLEFTRLGAPTPGPHLVVSGFDADASAVTDWIDITPLLQPGINQLNAMMDEILTELQGGPVAANTEIEYHVQGNSVPAATPTNFRWEVKLVFQVVGEREFEVPFGA